MEKERIEGAIIEEPEEVPQSTWVLVGQFFVVPVVIVALCVGIFILFGLITGDARTARDYLEEVRAGKGNRRWQAAFELSKFLNQKGSQNKEPRLARDISSAFRNAKDDDPRVAVQGIGAGAHPRPGWMLSGIRRLERLRGRS